MTEVTPESTSQINYAYDNLYRLTNETRAGVNPFIASYAYDINSNRTQKVETVNGITETINYEYNANDQLLSEVSSANGTTVYTYDVNGSLTNKANEGKFSYQYGYDLRNRLATANITRKEGTADVTITSSYAYNVDGIRTRALQTINGNTQNRYFLLDDGHTGYAQVFEETAELGGNIIRSYTIGDDVLSQTVTGVTSHLLYDGHGSTRQLADNNGAVTANYAYDAYGKMLGGNPGVTDGKQSATDLLYTGEQFDPGLQMEYLRARYYDQDNGRFNRLDPFAGNAEDPQSLHKYAYAHCDPVNGIDPSGNNLVSVLAVTAILVSLSVVLIPTFTKVKKASVGVSLIPVIGSIWDAAYEFQEENYGWATFYSLLAISDVFLIKSLASAGIKLSTKLSTKGSANLASHLTAGTAESVTKRPGGIILTQQAGVWVKEVDTSAGKFTQWFARTTIEAQAEALGKLGPMAPKFYYANGKLVIADAGKFAGGWGEFMKVRLRGSWQMGVFFSDIVPRNIGSAGLIFDPALHPLHYVAYSTGEYLLGRFIAMKEKAYE